MFGDVINTAWSDSNSDSNLYWLSMPPIPVQLSTGLLYHIVHVHEAMKYLHLEQEISLGQEFFYFLWSDAATNSGWRSFSDHNPISIDSPRPKLQVARTIHCIKVVWCNFLIFVGKRADCYWKPPGNLVSFQEETNTRFLNNTTHVTFSVISG